MLYTLDFKLEMHMYLILIFLTIHLILGVYNITIDAKEGTMKFTGRVNPNTLLKVLEKYGKHAEVKYIKFEGEVIERNLNHYWEYGYNPYVGMHQYCSYPPPLPFHQHQGYHHHYPRYSQPQPAPPPPGSFRKSPPPPPVNGDGHGPPPSTSVCPPQQPPMEATSSRQNKQSNCAMM